MKQNKWQAKVWSEKAHEGPDFITFLCHYIAQNGNQLVK